MRKNKILLSLTPIYALVLTGLVVIAGIGNRVVTTMSEIADREDRHIVIIDPGHGGEDGGATSCTGILESKFNLDIALRLNDMIHLLGADTIMIRQTDRSVYTQGETIAQKKVSDLRERVRIINEADRAVLVSIHHIRFRINSIGVPKCFTPIQTEAKIWLQKCRRSSRNVCSRIIIENVSK